MGRIGYDRPGFPVREEIAASHSRFWARLAGPGSWWTGAERVAIATGVRAAWHCALCRQRRAAVSPNAVAGSHEGPGDLPEPAVDAIHRITTDPGRLTKKWLDGLVAAGLGVEAYVELVATVADVVSIDSFCLGIGVPLPPLPEPKPGNPSWYRPVAAVAGEAWVPMIPAGEASGAEEDLYPKGFVPNVARALSVVPEEVRTLKDLSSAHYLPAGKVADPSAPGYSLSRPQMELVAARVSALNQCFY